MIGSNEAIAFSLLVAAFVTVVPSVASAAPATVRTPSAADLDVARELHRQASALVRQGKQEEALAREFAAQDGASDAGAVLGAFVPDAPEAFVHRVRCGPSLAQSQICRGETSTCCVTVRSNGTPFYACTSNPLCDDFGLECADDLDCAKGTVCCFGEQAFGTRCVDAGTCAPIDRMCNPLAPSCAAGLRCFPLRFGNGTVDSPYAACGPP